MKQLTQFFDLTLSDVWACGIGGGERFLLTDMNHENTAIELLLYECQIRILCLLSGRYCNTRNN